MVFGPSAPRKTTAAPATVNVTSDAHVLYLFDVGRSGRYTVNVERTRNPTATGRWYFYRAELVRVR